jgi:hypothetical protein
MIALSGTSPARESCDQNLSMIAPAPDVPRACIKDQAISHMHCQVGLFSGSCRDGERRGRDPAQCGGIGE